MCLKIILKYAYNVYSSFEFFHLRFILFTIYCVVENNRFCQGQGDKFFFRYNGCDVTYSVYKSK